MSGQPRAGTRLGRPRYTIGGLMATIGGIALVLTALRPIAGLAESLFPALANALRGFATPETGIMLICLAVGAYFTLKLMSLDEM